MAKDLIASFLPAAEVFPNRPLTLQVGATFGPFYINLFASRPRLVGTYTADPDTDILTLASHGLSDGTMVQITPSTAKITDGLESGELYFVVTDGLNGFQLSKLPGAIFSSYYPIVDIKDNTGGRVYRCGTPYDLTNHVVWAWVKHLRTDPDNQIILNLDASMTGAALVGYDWQITFSKTKEQTFNLTPNAHVWSLLLQFPDGTRRVLIDNSRFTIEQPTTHPDITAMS